MIHKKYIDKTWRFVRFFCQIFCTFARPLFKTNNFAEKLNKLKKKVTKQVECYTKKQKQ